MRLVPIDLLVKERLSCSPLHWGEGLGMRGILDRVHSC